MPTTAYSVEGLITWRNITDAQRFATRLQRNVRRATKLNAFAAMRKMRQVLKSGDFKRNSALTQALKGSDRPLNASGDLFQSVTLEMLDEDTYFVGVLRTEGAYNVVEVIHEGVTITVTPAMRWMFLFLAKASDGSMDPSKLEGRAAELFGYYQGWKPLQASTTTIVIPGRPFVSITFHDARLIQLCQQNWGMAVEYALNPKKPEKPSAFEKAAKKMAAKAKKVGRVASKAKRVGKKYGKKAGRVGKKAFKSGKRIGKKAIRGARKAGKKLSKRLRGGKGRKR